jgi:molybdenum cofactor biosynthesis protein B
MAHKSHHSDLPKDLRFLVIVTSDTLLDAWSHGEMPADASGDAAESLVLGFGHTMAGRLCLHNDVKTIRSAVLDAVRGGRVDVVVISGGTGLGPKDRTVEAVSPILEKTLPGFGELFRQLSFGEVGTSAMASRALAGACGKVLIFALPGSPKAVMLAMERLILPESPHLLKMLQG